MDLSIIIVNWNSKDYLKKCIESIFTCTSGINYEIVVIDGGSFDGCEEMLRLHFPQVRFIQHEKNLGFAGANNVAFNDSSGRIILFLNPDTEIEGPAVNTLYHQLNSLPNAGIVGAKLLNPDRSVQTSCVQSFPTILNQLLNSEFLRALFPRSTLWGTASLFGVTDRPAEVDVLSGACIMLRRMLFEQVGHFSEDYFMYAEDVDLCYKSRQAGYINYYIPGAVVVHFGGGSSEKGPSDFSVVMMRESIWRFMKKTRGNIYGMAYRASTLISAIGRLLLLMVLLPLQPVRKNGTSWNASLKKWKAILTWSLGLKDMESYQP
jgi:N-acetylglucosaminyl-diphospho-decaprenol L-rhamnosyltransferase